uniref:Transcription factor IIIC subunit Tfc1/Sfc1 triple barrel domain-containing protein n=1 Tax=Varanus komodoensis TaxID=61221 RepID=A0A8D2IVL3_VARKO
MTDRDTWPAGDPAAVTPAVPRDKRLVCVEYPGVVRDVDKALLTLGGEEGVSRVRPSP